MSSQGSPAPIPDPLIPKEIPQVTDAYRKAHKSYVLMSGLLASWALIGITLNTKDKWGLELKSPSAVPWILFTLVLYSGYRLAIEWDQCDLGRRKNRAANLDNWTAHVIAVIALAIAGAQYLLRIRIVDLINQHARTQAANAVFAGISFGFLPCLIVVVIAQGSKKHSKIERLVVIAAVSLLFAFAIPFAIRLHQFRELVIGSIIGFVLGGSFTFLVKIKKRQIAQRQSSVLDFSKGEPVRNFAL